MTDELVRIFEIIGLNLSRPVSEVDASKGIIRRKNVDTSERRKYVEMMISDLEVDQDGGIDFSEYLTLMAGTKDVDLKSNLRMLFDSMDMDKDDLINFEELRNFMSLLWGREERRQRREDADDARRVEEGLDSVDDHTEEDRKADEAFDDEIEEMMRVMVDKGDQVDYRKVKLTYAQFETKILLFFTMQFKKEF